MKRRIKRSIEVFSCDKTLLNNKREQCSICKQHRWISKTCWVEEVRHEEHIKGFHISEVEETFFYFDRNQNNGSQSWWWLTGRRYETTLWDDGNLYNLIETVFTGCIYAYPNTWITNLRYVHFSVCTLPFNEKEKCQVTPMKTGTFPCTFQR